MWPCSSGSSYTTRVPTTCSSSSEDFGQQQPAQPRRDAGPGNDRYTAQVKTELKQDRAVQSALNNCKAHFK